MIKEPFLSFRASTPSFFLKTPSTTLLCALAFAALSGCRKSDDASVRPGVSRAMAGFSGGPGDSDPSAAGWFRAVGEEEAYREYRAHVEDRKDWSRQDLERKYPIAYGRGPGYGARKVEFGERVEERLQGWADGQRWVGNWKADEYLDRVRKDGMAVTEAIRYPNYFQALDAIFHADLPLLFTTDALLQTVYLSYDKILIHLETQVFIPALKEILDSSLAHAKARYGNQPHEQDVRALLLTAKHLLDPEGTTSAVPQEVRDYVAAARALHLAQVKLFGRDTTVDFTQFKPRGHYTQSPELQAYFQAMMWLSRADLAFHVGRGGKAPSARTRMKKAALVLWDCVEKSGSYPAWEKMNRFLDYMVGIGDGLGLDGLRRLAQSLRIRNMHEYLEEFDEGEFDERLAAGDFGTQMVLSQSAAETDKSHAEDALEPIIAFMPQRFALDSYTFSQLVHTQVPEKWMPSPLELAFALGDNSAHKELPEQAAPNYPGLLASQRDLYDALGEATWNGSLYSGWLHCLAKLNGAESNPRADAAFRTESWRMKMRNTQLASWAQLRHNTILYVKQSYTSRVLCDFPRVYVEPYPDFFGAVATYALQGEALFQGTYPSQVADYFRNLATVAGKLHEVAERTAQGRSPTNAQTAWLKTALAIERDPPGCGGGRPDLVYRGWYMGLNYGYSRSAPAEKTDYTIADVHTKLADDAGPARVLHVATGPVQLVTAALRLDTCVSYFVGPVATYYEVTRTGSEPERLTDEEWKEALRKEAGWVERPEWAKAFLAR